MSTVDNAYEAIVVGGGAVGASALFHLAELGATRSLLIERQGLASGGTGKSCAIVRTHYSIPSNTQLAVESLEMLRSIREVLGDDAAESGFRETGYLILAPDGDTATTLVANLERQHAHGANTQLISHEAALELHPLLDLRDIAAIGYEAESGYADPYLTTTSLIRAATNRGATVVTRTAATEILVEHGRARGVRTTQGDYYADAVILAVGPWTRSFTDQLGIELPQDLYRHTVLTFRPVSRSYPDLPIVKDLAVENKMYFRPAAGGVALVGTGDFGVPIEDPDDMDGPPDLELIALQGDQLVRRMPAFDRASLANSWCGPYDVTPDWNPVLDEAPGIGGLIMAFGFSGHGFKLAPMVGKLLAGKLLGHTDDRLSPYRYSRFAEGDYLIGSYGVGSIS